MKRPIVFIQGAFDILHYSHLKVFEKCRHLAEDGTVIVGLNTHELLEDYKNVEEVLPFSHKKYHLETLPTVDYVVPMLEFSPMNMLRALDVDIFCIAKEWKHTKSKEMAYMREQGKQVYFMPRFEGTSTSEIERKILDRKGKKKKAEDHPTQ